MTTTDQQRVLDIRSKVNLGFYGHGEQFRDFQSLLSLITVQEKEYAGLKRVMQGESEDWAECHTFPQNAGIQMDPVDSYSGATCLIDGIKQVIAQRDQARADVKRWGKHDDTCARMFMGIEAIHDQPCTCGFTAKAEGRAL